MSEVKKGNSSIDRGIGVIQSRLTPEVRAALLSLQAKIADVRYMYARYTCGEYFNRENRRGIREASSKVLMNILRDIETDLRDRSGNFSETGITQEEIIALKVLISIREVERLAEKFRRELDQYLSISSTELNLFQG